MPSYFRISILAKFCCVPSHITDVKSIKTNLEVTDITKMDGELRTEIRYGLVDRGLTPYRRPASHTEVSL